jgi:multidrug efflux pump
MEAITFIEMMLFLRDRCWSVSLGVLFNRRGRKHLILTDNRARLLTGTLGALVAIVMMFIQWLPPASSSSPRPIRTRCASRPRLPSGPTSRRATVRHSSCIRACSTSWMSNDDVPSERREPARQRRRVGGDVMFGGGAAGPERSNFTFNLLDYEETP